MATMTEDTIYDCIIIGAGPGGLQAAIYLGRYNRKALLIDRGGGRTSHARHIENFLTQKAISGKELIALGLEQAKSFNVSIEKGLVTNVVRHEHFSVYAGEKEYLSKFVIVSSGATENLPPIENIPKFFGDSFFTCIDCDGYRTRGKKLVVIGNSLHSVHLALAMKEMYTEDLSLILYTLVVPPVYIEELAENGIRVVTGRPKRLFGRERLEGIEMEHGGTIACEVVMSNFGYKLNADFLAGLQLKKDADNFKFATNRHFESSCDGLYIVGPLTGNDQAIIAAGEGALVAIELKKRLLEQ
ncbi:MAG: NAD(P)/FAD-dependent oxidoreductase [Thermodesulfovibrio sp.]|nr:NAD(P)/FAD-dependent oxidoreductase [Thermodesulfovibrio sp.]